MPSLFRFWYWYAKMFAPLYAMPTRTEKRPRSNVGLMFQVFGAWRKSAGWSVRRGMPLAWEAV